MSDARPVQLTASGPPSTVLPDEPNDLLIALARAVAASDRDAIFACVAAAPRQPRVWAAAATVATDEMERYAYYRVGYHRGLDLLRANGWRGSGYVRWNAPSNRGFLTCLAGLAQSAAEIGEADEAERCELFLRQCDPSWPPADGVQLF